MTTTSAKDANGDLAAHLSNLSVDEHSGTARQILHTLPVYPNVHTPPRPAPFAPYDGSAQFLYYAAGGPALDPAAFASAAAAASSHQYSYDLNNPMHSLASAVAAGMYDPYATPPPDNYSPDRSSISSSVATPNFQPTTPAFQPSRVAGTARVNTQVYRPPHIQQQLQQQLPHQVSQTYFAAYDDRVPFWAPGRENGSGGRHRHVNSGFGSGGRARGSQHNLFTSQTDFAPYGLQAPLTPAFTGPGSQFTIPTAFGPYTPSAHFGYKGRRHVSADDPSVVRSQRLESFRQRKTTRLEFSDIYGNICEFAGDQHGSRFIQNKLENASPEERAKVFEEIMPNAHQLMTDVFGNYVIQKMFQYGDEQQVSALAVEMGGHVLQLSMQMYGCRVMQKALEHVQDEQREKLISELEGHIIDCVKSSNANHVVQRLISLDPPQTITDAFKGHVQELSSHPFGCRVLQKSFEVLDPTKIRCLLDEMHTCTLSLIFDQFGNYVVQSVISDAAGREADRDKVIQQMKTRIFELCRHKFASNVVERAIRFASASDRRDIIREMLGDPADKENRIATLLRDSFGNFTVQTALNEADADQRDELLAIILPLMPNLRHTPCGRRLEAKISEYESKGMLQDLGIDDTETVGSCASLESDASLGIGTNALRRVATSPDAADEAIVLKALMV